MLVASEREADFCPNVCVSTCTDIRTYTTGPFIPVTVSDKTSRWPNNFHSVKSIYAEKSEYFGNELKSGRRCSPSMPHNRISLVLPATGIRARAGIQVCIVDVIRGCNHVRKISDVRRKLSGVALRNRGRIVAHRRSWCAITRFVRRDAGISAIPK